MIGEDLQDQAPLYALGILPAGEAEAFERALAENAELARLARELREAAGELARVPDGTAPPALKGRVLAEIAGPRRAGLPIWLPWALAACLALCCGVLGIQQSRLRRQLLAANEADPLPEVAIYSLSGPDAAAPGGRITVAWAPGCQRGRVQISGVPAPAPGKDYQLWAVDADHPAPINAGIVRVDNEGRANVDFQPGTVAPHVQAFAISLEPLGGSSQKTGPILFSGKD
jgi:anti-sigma-K factor RskA